MVDASGVRISWADIPAHVRKGIEEILGGRVVEAVSQRGGFSPGSADRVRLDDGRRAFVKAVSADLNPDSPGLHRREATNTAQLPDDVPASQLLGCYDDGHWVALVFADVDGRTPPTPWQYADIVDVLAALQRLSDRLTPCPVDDLPSLAEELRGAFAGWQELRDDLWDGLPDVAAAHLDELVELSALGLRALEGDTLVHTDIRADNLLIRPDRSVVVVDWPWACRGCAWFDTLCVLLNVELYGGHDVEALLADTPLLARVPADAIDGVLAGLGGFFYNAGRRPASPGLPTLRQFQRDQGDAVLRWLSVRRTW
jgi:hypothetical protein